VSEDNVQTVQTIYEAFGRGDLPAILEKLDPDVVWDHDGHSWGIPWYEPRTGRDDVTKFFGALADGLVIHRLDPTNILVGGDQGAVGMDFESEVKGTGRNLRDTEIHLWTFGGDGLITRFAHVVDRHPHAAGVRGQQP
jgi:ketosteroid isomerase-like protein